MAGELNQRRQPVDHPTEGLLSAKASRSVTSNARRKAAVQNGGAIHNVEVTGLRGFSRRSG